jgi:hypothetical protein
VTSWGRVQVDSIDIFSATSISGFNSTSNVPCRPGWGALYALIFGHAVVSVVRRFLSVFPARNLIFTT